jgi:anti-sigma regulatory factor (Ser/Thr protein kinase)
MMAEKEITIKNQLTQIAVIADTLESLSDEWNVPMSVILSLNLVLEELVSNIIFYGYDDTNEHIIQIYLSLNHEIIQMRIEDDGKAFNPLLSTEPDIGLAVEDRKIGGLGIHFVRNIMDDLSYERLNNKNILSMSKNIHLTE